MDPQQIRDALGVFGTLETRGYENTIHQAASEHADLLEASERIWWCETVEARDRTPETDYEDVCTCPPQQIKVGEWSQPGCGWRLLSTERTEG